MVQILITVIIAAIILPLAYFQFKETLLPKKMLVAGVVIVAALVSAILQFFDFALYVQLLALVAVSLVGAIGYGKVDEMEKQEKRRIVEKRRSNIPLDTQITEPEVIAAEPAIPDEPIEEEKTQATIETIPVKSYSMQSITPERKEP